jgi:membrane protease YdiL (CAAX protease family)
MARWIELAAHQIGILFLVGYILRQSGRSFRDIGFRWSFKEITDGLWLYVAAYLFYRSGAFLIYSGYHLLSGSYPHYVDARQIFGHLPLFAFPFWLLNPFYEEIVVRAYLMTEIRNLTGSVILSAAASVVLQTSYHLYYGWAGALALGIQFVAFVGYFAIWRRALPLAIAHGLFDLVGFIRLR